MQVDKRGAGLICPVCHPAMQDAQRVRPHGAHAPDLLPAASDLLQLGSGFSCTRLRQGGRHGCTPRPRHCAQAALLRIGQQGTGRVQLSAQQVNMWMRSLEVLQAMPLLSPGSSAMFPLCTQVQLHLVECRAVPSPGSCTIRM